MDDRLHLLLATTSGEPLLADGVDRADAAVGSSPDVLPAPTDLWCSWTDPNDLRRQRWGVIAPAGEAGDRLVDAIAPLMTHRRDQQAGEPVAVFRAPAGQGMSIADAAQWKRSQFDAGDDDHDLPRYQLILGDLDQVPLAIQQAQAIDGLVGRIAFDRDDDYRAYADKVVHAERHPTDAAAAAAILHSVHDDTLATRHAYATLIAPGHDALTQWHQRGALHAADVRTTGSATPSPDELWTVANPGLPSVLFTLSRGIGPPTDGWANATEQRRTQGGLSLGAGERITGADLADRAFAPGGVWMVLAGFGAGTPAKSAYRPWLRSLVDAGALDHAHVEHVMQSLAMDGRPFIAAAPKAALVNPAGPLAVIGHVDLAWSYAFANVDAGSPLDRANQLMAAVQSVLDGSRVGAGFRALCRALAAISAELAPLANGASDADRVRRAHLWMTRQDLATYILLGDPAARLPLADAHATVTPSTRANRAATANVAGVEVAIGKVLSELQSIDEVAREHGMDETELARLVDRYRAAGRAAISGIS